MSLSSSSRALPASELRVGFDFKSESQLRLIECSAHPLAAQRALATTLRGCRTIPYIRRSRRHSESGNQDTAGCPLWAKSGHLRRKEACPLYPRKQTFAVQYAMSATGQKRTFVSY